ncbi:hypothetical protein BH11PSE3_BH11PSE3_12430 [soil metagenome]
MTPESVARHFEQRQGYELVDYAPVALPLYRVTVDAITMIHRAIPPIKEFVMRAVAAGLTDPMQIAGFLGIDQLTVNATLNQLIDDRYMMSPDEGGVAALSDRGRLVLNKMHESAPQNETLVFLYDRLLLKPVLLSPDQWMFPHSVNLQQTIEIRPYPAEGPALSDLSLPDVAHVLAQQAGGRAQFGRDLLRLNHISRRVRLFRPGVALVFKKHRSSDIQIAFVVDDAPSLELEHAFANRGGPKWMGFIKSVNESATMSELRKYVGPAAQNLSSNLVDIDKRRIAVSLAKFRHETALARAERGGQSAESANEAEAATALTDAEQKLREPPARPVAAYEPAEFLDTALDKSRTLLMISSRTVDRAVVDASFIGRLAKVLQRGARVVLALTEVPVSTEKAAIDLERLRQRYPRLELLVGRRRQFHHLICDDSFAVVGNQPFLSNRGKVRSFHHVIGYVLQKPHLVRAFAERVDSNKSGTETEPRKSSPMGLGRRQSE